MFGRFGASPPPADKWFMATQVKAECSECEQTVTVLATQVRLNINRMRTGCFYDFLCPSCGERSQQEADEDIVALLKSAGVLVRDIPEPKITDHEVAVFTEWLDGHDPLLDGLSREKWFRLQRPDSPGSPS